VRPEEAGIGAQPAIPASCASELKQSNPAISPMNLAAGRTPIRSLRAAAGGLGDQRSELVLQSTDRAGQLADAADHVASDPDRTDGSAPCGRRVILSASWDGSAL
jgi:hypothetical protein